MKRVLQNLWFDFIMFVTAWMPDFTPVLRLRGFLCRPAFKRCGANLQVAHHVQVGFSNKMEFGRDVFLGYGAWLSAGGGLVIEDEVIIGPYAVIVAGDHTAKDGSYRFGASRRAPIILGKGCWIASHATVTAGVRVGKGALLAANAVATKDVPDHAVAAGVPARVVRQGSVIP